jgi:hypothetical protein
MKKMAWAFRSKARYISQLEQFGALVQRLYSLVPPENMKDIAKNILPDYDPDSFDGMRVIFIIFLLCFLSWIKSLTISQIQRHGIQIPSGSFSRWRSRLNVRFLTAFFFPIYANNSRRNEKRIEYLARCILD